MRCAHVLKVKTKDFDYMVEQIKQSFVDKWTSRTSGRFRISAVTFAIDPGVPLDISRLPFADK